MTPRDTRSVGELLLACDRDTRALLLDADDLDAAALVRAWPEVVQAAHELLTLLPISALRSADTAHRSPANLVGERLRMTSDGTHRHLASRAWPGTGASDPRLIDVADAFVRAHDLIRSTWRSLPPDRVDVLADAAAARTRVLHSVYVATHAVALAVRREIRDREHGPNVRSRHMTHRLAALRYTRDRLEVAERIAGSELYRGFPGTLTGEHHDPPSAGRVATALARWDIAAHRALATDPVLPTLFEVTRVQAAATAMTHRILSVAASHGRLDASTFHAHGDAPLAAAAAAWQTLHADLRDLTPPAIRLVRGELPTAGAELVAALAEIVIDGTSMASAATVIGRSSPETVRAAAENIPPGHDLATTVHDTITDCEITVTARAAQSYLARHMGSGVTESPTCAWIEPQDLTADRALPLPKPVADDLQRRARCVREITGGLSAAPDATRPGDRVPGGDPRSARRPSKAQINLRGVAALSR